MRDLKLVQRGVNVQANDLAVPAGTPVRAQNIDYQRDGVAARRAGFNSFYNGLPSVPFDSLQPLVGYDSAAATGGLPGDTPDTRGLCELFSRDHAFLFQGGWAFSYDELTGAWSCVPVSMPHRFTFFGTINGHANSGGSDLGTEYAACGIGRAVSTVEMFRVSDTGRRLWSPFSFQCASSGVQLYGDIGNAVSEAAEQATRRNVRYGQIADVVVCEPADLSRVFSDSAANVLWNTNVIIAGSLTASGSANGTGTAALFSGPSWMAADASAVYVADNANMIRKVATGGVVTTLAGSITAGDSDGYKAPTAGRWTQHNASSSANWGSIAYSSTLGSGSGRLCAIETGTSTNKAMTSDDGGSTWTARTLPSSRTWMSITWAAGLSLFVAVAQDGTTSGQCATSPDGITWTARTMPAGQWASVAWSSSLSRLVAVGLSGGPSYACTSTNGISWTTSGVTQISGYWVSVCSAGSLGFVAVGQFDTGSGQVMVASTGLNWSSGTVTAANQWMTVAYSATLGRLVAVSQDGADRIMYSTNGSSWSAASAPEANLWSGVCWSDSFGVFIAVSQDGTNRIMYSQTGTGGWTAAAAPDTNQWYAIVDAPLIGYTVSTSLGVLDAVMRANANGATATGSLFRSISGLAYADGFLYVLESSGNRIRKVDVTSGVVSLVAGSDVAASGFVDGTGSAARFNAPNGIEYIGGALYVGDTGNSAIRKVTLEGVVTTYATHAAPTLRGRWQPRRGTYSQSDPQFLVLESTPSSVLLDVHLLEVSDSTAFAHHVIRCPSGYPDGTTGPNKLDTMGPNLFSLANARGVDCGNGAAFVTSSRPHVIDTWSRNVATDYQPRLRPLGINAPMAPSVTAVAGTTFAASMTVAYRVVMGLNLPDGRIALGPPSERIILAGSTTATWSGSVIAYPAPGLPYEGQAFVQLYRTRSGSITVDPGDQMFLCYEAALSYGSGLTITDQLPDDLLGAELYTNTTQDTVAATAVPPPSFVGDIASFDKRIAIADYVEPASIRLTVLGTSSLVAGSSRFTLTPTPSGPMAGSQLFGGIITLTAISGATNPSANEFQIATGGTAAQNAVQTARNIAECINRSPDAMLFSAAYDESQPGTVVVSLLWPGTSKARVSYYWNGFNYVPTTAQAGIAFSASSLPVLNSISVTQQGISLRESNELAYSEQGAFDSFPVTNRISVGSGSEGIVRLLPISDTLLAVKDDSVWSMDQGFEPRIYDRALSCVLPDSFANVNNQWIGLFTRGFVALSASQAVAIGRPIDRDVSGQYGSYLDGSSTDRASAAAIDLSGNYLCAFNARAYAYNIVSQCWSDWSIDVVAGNVSGGFEATTVGAYRDSFMVAQNGARGVLRQRRYQRDGGDWYQDFADPTYALGTATLAADLQTLTISAYSMTVNPASLPPLRVDPPAGAVDSAGNDAADFWWVFSLTQGSVTAQAFGVAAVTTPSSATSAITITLSQPVTTLTAGTMTVTGYPPIICRVQYAPFATPGGNARFGDALITVERCQPGYMISRFFGRQDLGDATEQAIGWYGDSYGVSRAKLMPSITAGAFGVGSLISYNDVVRVPVARERAVGQTLGLELWEGVAWQPLAIKAVTLDKGDKDNAKVTQ